MIIVTEDDNKFLNSWKDTSLLFENWTHKSHLRMAFLIIGEGSEEGKDFDSIYKIIKNGIQKYNEKNKEKINIGYHETITQFWIKIVQKTLEKYKEEKITFENFIKNESFLLNTSIMYEYYNKETIFSKKAKENLIEPDIKKI
jgi:hypothetical protein